MMRRALFLACCLAGAGVPLRPTVATEGCCMQCGAVCATQVVCWPFISYKVVEYTVWDVACEDICLTPPGEPCTWSISRLLGQPSCSSGASSVIHQWFGSRCAYRPRSRLLRKTFVQYVPVQECVVQHLCDACCAKASWPAHGSPAGAAAGGPTWSATPPAWCDGTSGGSAGMMEGPAGSWPAPATSDATWAAPGGPSQENAMPGPMNETNSPES